MYSCMLCDLISYIICGTFGYSVTVITDSVLLLAFISAWKGLGNSYLRVEVLPMQRSQLPSLPKMGREGSWENPATTMVYMIVQLLLIYLADLYKL